MVVFFVSWCYILEETLTGAGGLRASKNFVLA